jgi:hypothetical protein
VNSRHKMKTHADENSRRLTSLAPQQPHRWHPNSSEAQSELRTGEEAALMRRRQHPEPGQTVELTGFELGSPLLRSITNRVTEARLLHR